MFRPIAVAFLFGCSAGCAAANEEVGVEEGHLESGSCHGSPQFEKIRTLVEAVPQTGSSYAHVLKNKIDLEPLERGPRIFTEMADLIAAAEADVTFQTWRWDNDGEPARLILDGIKRLDARLRAQGRRDKPVIVRLLINAIAFSPKDQMVALGRKVEALGVDPKSVDVRLAEFVAVKLGANHSKTLVVDARRAIITGANASADNAGTGPIYWDVGFRVEGEVARALHNDFATAWADGERWICGGAKDDDTCRTKPESIPIMSPSLEGTHAGLECIPVMVAGRKERTPLFPTDNNDYPQNQAFIGMMAFAEKRIRIQTPNLNDDTPRNAILAAIRSGIAVELLLSKNYEQLTESVPGRGGANDHTAEWLHSIAYEIPVVKRCRLLQIRWFSNDGTFAVEVNGPPSSHVKYMSIDGKIAMIGSANQDVQSWQNSREINLVIDSATITRRFDEKVFEASWNKAIPVDQCAGMEK